MAILSKGCKPVNFEPQFEPPPETLKYQVGVQRDQSYLMGRRYLLSLGWLPIQGST